MSIFKKIGILILSLCLVFCSTSCSNFSPSDQDIYDSFLDAYDFYYKWVYGQYYITDDPLLESNGIYYAETNHNEIKTAEQLIEKVNSYYSKSKAYEYINQLKPRNENGKLYINCNMGVGDNGIAFDSYSIEKIDNKTYILTIYLQETPFIEKGSIAKVLCIKEGNKLLFDNYTSSQTLENYQILF